MSSICQLCKMLRAESIVLLLVVSFALSISALEIGLSQNRNGTSSAAAKNSSILNVMEKCNKTFQISAGERHHSIGKRLFLIKFSKFSSFDHALNLSKLNTV